MPPKKKRTPKKKKKSKISTGSPIEQPSVEENLTSQVNPDNVSENSNSDSETDLINAENPTLNTIAEVVDTSASTMSAINKNMNVENQNQPMSIIPFDPDSGMDINAWLNYYNNLNSDDTWKLKNITSCLKSEALKFFINYGSQVSSWGELQEILKENFLTCNLKTFDEFNNLKYYIYHDLNKYFHTKIEIGRKLKLTNSLILEGLTDGMPYAVKQGLTISSPENLASWLNTATRLLSLEKPRMNQNGSRPHLNQNYHRPQFNSNYPYRPASNAFGPRFPSFNRPAFNMRWQQPPQNNQRFPNPRLPAFSQRRPTPNHTTHYQNTRYPPYPCPICEGRSIPNAFHWIANCPFKEDNSNMSNSDTVNNESGVSSTSPPNQQNI